MIKQLSLRNFALIRRAQLDFAPGFNVITGETGAGKSMVLGGLSLLAGERGGSQYIGLDGDEAQLLVEFADGLRLERQLRLKGSRSLINGEAVKINELGPAAAANYFIYGQRQNQELLKNEEQRARLDRFGQLDLSAVAAAYERWQELERQLAERRHQREELERQRDLLEFQWQELERAAPQPGEFEALSQRQRQLSSADDLQQRGDQLSHLTAQLVSSSQSAAKMAQQLAELDSSWQEGAEFFEQSLIYLREAEEAVSHCLSHIDHSPEALQQVEQRMALLYELGRKHRCPPEQLPQRWAELGAQLQALADADDGELERALGQAQRDYQRAAEELSERRRALAGPLAELLEGWLGQLAMERARFHIELTPTAASGQGIDLVKFFIAPNVGQPLMEMEKIVSGGELARISLALEVATAEHHRQRTLIFDEIDTGIGGEVAHSIGKLLRQLGEKRQVICITHLAQVACQGHHHIHLEKRDDGRETVSRARVLSGAERVREIARMLGDSQSENSLNLARTLLNHS